MIDLNTKIITKENWKNDIIQKNINLDKNLDLFIVADSNNPNITELITSKIIDFSIDNITKENTYKDFALLLENINSILKTIRQDNKEEHISIIIWILDKNKLYFSNIWTTSAYLIKTTNEVIEITEKDEQKKEFLFISEWKLDNLDTIIFSTQRLLNYLSYSDFSDSVIWKKAEQINNNINLILSEENLEENIWLLSFKYYFLLDWIENKSKFKEKFSTFLLKLLDNSLTKKIIAYYLIVKEKLSKQSKIIQNWFYLIIISLSIFALYLIINWIFSTTISTKTIEQNKENLTKAMEYVRIASNNSSNSDIFNLNIKKAEKIVSQLKEKKLFLNDVNNLSNDINIIKKQFNWIETYDINNSNLIYKLTQKNPVKIVKINLITYLITKNSVIWPIIPWKTPKKHIFTQLKDDSFIDASALDNSIILITKQWKVVEFSKNWYFSYKDVKWQKLWEKSDTILSYAQNIYLIPQTKNQIFKHKKMWKVFSEAIPYLKKEDTKSIWKILDIAIDWWIYILKNDLSIVKFFSTPYRLEKIVINKLPDNYKKENNWNIKIKTRKDLNYVYILLNNKIWVFKPNTRRFQDTKALTYLWQIEASNWKIQDFYVNHDSDIDILTDSWIYKLNFEVNDNKIIVR